jgi:hypothetical protein
MLFAAAALAALPIVSAPASTHAPAPLLPTALVEDVKSAAAGVAFMDYVGNKQVIRLARGDVLVLSYLRSCEHEIITGGTVTVGMEQSDVLDGDVVRTKVPCDGNVQLTSSQANASAATAFRLQNADTEATLFAVTPVVQLPKDLAAADRTLTIRRTDRLGEQHQLKLDDTAVAAGFYDAADSKISLVPGGTYDVSIGEHKLVFHVDADAKSAPVAVVSRLLRFQ